MGADRECIAALLPPKVAAGQFARLEVDVRVFCRASRALLSRESGERRFLPLLKWKSACARTRRFALARIVYRSSSSSVSCWKRRCLPMPPLATVCDGVKVETDGNRLDLPARVGAVGVLREPAYHVSLARMSRARSKADGIDQSSSPVTRAKRAWMWGSTCSTNSGKRLCANPNQIALANVREVIGVECNGRAAAARCRRT